MKVNGKTCELKTQMTLQQWLESEGYTIARIAVELNGKVIPKAVYSEMILHNDDVLEVVSFVGGG